MDLGRAGSTHFFTGTLIHDANNDGAYNQGEGRPGIRVLLHIGGTPHAYFDSSSSAGNFAIPIQSIADGVEVHVHLLNSTDSSVSVSLPQDYDQYTEIAMPPGLSHFIGSFLQPTTSRNVGFRNLTPPPLPLEVPHRAVIRLIDQVQLRWNSNPGINYQAQWTTDWRYWSNLSPTPLAGTGGELIVSESPSPNDRTQRFYRVIAE
jgi:hypothetical protein